MRLTVAQGRRSIDIRCLTVRGGARCPSGRLLGPTESSKSGATRQIPSCGRSTRTPSSSSRASAIAPRAGILDQGAVYVVPGKDFPEQHQPIALDRDDPDSPRKVVVPHDTSGKTDLASVPSVFWWLIASYGNHTRATLLHDAMYVETGEPPVPRKTADRLFLGALRESPQKAGPFRHWLMWAAVSAFGLIPHRLGVLFRPTCRAGLGADDWRACMGLE